MLDFISHISKMLKNEVKLKRFDLEGYIFRLKTFINKEFRVPKRESSALRVARSEVVRLDPRGTRHPARGTFPEPGTRNPERGTRYLLNFFL